MATISDVNTTSISNINDVSVSSISNVNDVSGLFSGGGASLEGSMHDDTGFGLTYGYFIYDNLTIIEGVSFYLPTTPLSPSGAYLEAFAYGDCTVGSCMASIEVYYNGVVIYYATEFYAAYHGINTASSGLYQIYMVGF